MRELTMMFNKRVKEGDFQHDVVRLLYNTRTKSYLRKSYDERVGEIKKPIPKDEVAFYDKILVEHASLNPNKWVGPSLGDPGDPGTENAPEYLATQIKTIYQQHSNRYCLTYSLASALFYCGFKNAASVLTDQAKLFSEMHFDDALCKLRELMVHLAPEIALPTFYGKRTRRHSRVLRHLTWEALMTELTSYPTVVIPVLPNGATTHAFCVVDDLIFESTTPNALRLQTESIKWIFNDQEVKIYQALRFNMKCSPPGMKVDTVYRRTVTLHWKHHNRPDIDNRQAQIQHHKNHLVYTDKDGKEHRTGITIHRQKKEKRVAVGQSLETL